MKITREHDEEEMLPSVSFGFSGNDKDSNHNKQDNNCNGVEAGKDNVLVSSQSKSQEPRDDKKWSSGEVPIVANTVQDVPLVDVTVFKTIFAPNITLLVLCLWQVSLWKLHLV